MRVLILLIMSSMFLMSSSASGATNLKEAFSKGSLKGEIRTYYFTRDFDGDTQDREDMAVGTMLFYHTDPLYGVSAGLTFASGNDLASDDDKAVYGLLQRGDDGDHESFTRMQEYYIQGEWYNTTIKYGAQKIGTPFMNPHDIRLMPKTYKGLSIVNRSVENLTLSGYYITGFMGWSDDEYMPIMDSVGSGGDDNPLLSFGAQYKFPVEAVNLKAEAWQYHMDDVFNSTYLKGTIGKTFNDYALHITPSYLIQKSVGDDVGGDFDTDQYGFNAGVDAFGFSVTGYYAYTGDDDLFVPWGDGKVLIQQIMASGRAEENAYALKVNYDFGKLGLKGLSAYVFHAIYDTPESGSNASSDINETDFNIQYSFSGALDGVSVRVRYAMVDFDEGEDFNDFRVYVKYTFAIGSGK
ncbi:outer membrane porin [Denitrovibrio acetiphilus DSM 12809]|uniref:Outer membrane porin n=1 Tax=Denitrovibrio acetiphilus (strain DSM 12809 / NBRC 114555 / N2460) TaxID=522772 RepID=D4H525_DENA2|nr:OprD family outer membrane porin [Denitrovibrio acetiphilus]ADD69381.1 outer membrane porin [Denitrovibrio acetiphilus DSM 12809]